MTTIDITIKAPSLPDGWEVYTGEGVPPKPYYFLSATQNWYLIDDNNVEVRALAYAVPITKTKPKSRLRGFVNVYEYDGLKNTSQVIYRTREQAESAQREANGWKAYAIAEIFDVDGVPTPEERLIEAVGKVVAKEGEPRQRHNKEYRKGVFTMTHDTRPPVSPIEGHYAVLRNGHTLLYCPRPKGQDNEAGAAYDREGRAWCGSEGDEYGRASFDIIATIPPDLMAAMADGRVGALMKDTISCLSDFLCDVDDMKIEALDNPLADLLLRFQALDDLP